MITERRNSLIAGTCARSVAGVPNGAYPHDFKPRWARGDADGEAAVASLAEYCRMMGN
ncbi:hypothetical protein [Streptomyces chattanoogensis]|uniref:hypothetical protein n=1 Tax=Streptomyces chattanoogensis TaxID=66876 RepID=UPI0012FED41C|nr:hypothetical protein [Streptomyces chattanoogensis]